MIIDSRLPQGVLAITAATGTNLLTDVLDLAGLQGSGGADLVDAPNAYQPNWTRSSSTVTTGSVAANDSGLLQLRIVVAGGSTGLTAVGGGDIRFQLVSAQDAAMSTGVSVALDSGSITTSTTGIPVGTVLVQVAIPATALQRFVAIRTVVGTSALNATAALRTVAVSMGLEVPSAKRVYADNIA